MASSKNGSTGARPGGSGSSKETPTATFTPTDDTTDSGSPSERSKGSDSSRGTSRTGGSGSGSSSRTGTSSSGGAGGSAARSTGAKSTGAARTGSSGAPSRSQSSANRGASRSPAKTATAPSPTARTGPRRIRLTLSRIDPFSVMKMAFLISIAVGIATVVAVAVLWNLVEVIGIWDKIDEIGRDLNNDKPLPFMDYFKFSKMISYATIAAVVDIVIITALGTLLAFLYNIVAALLGGLKMTFTDE
ncbi:hypothetical protein DEO23_08930 [Brachybacterium endophyticum]|uniref:DUF3566 domain-containing protein n=1 Tax=Brachybacterium endophyticum TaxID=2182385 RepID=A0A2U2RJA6_9MICO|nr:DUF3566 domain-containing protein [Brachybacterium endophyticum]PWH05948.1 hypothetical protein DEO23_08930 [Brachybacterium endophyticum]